MVQLVLPSRQSKPRRYWIANRYEGLCLGTSSARRSIRRADSNRVEQGNCNTPRRGIGGKDVAHRAHTPVLRCPPRALGKGQPSSITSICGKAADVALVHAGAANVDGKGRLAAEEVGQLAIIVAFVNGEIGELAGFER